METLKGLSIDLAKFFFTFPCSKLDHEQKPNQLLTPNSLKFKILSVPFAFFMVNK